MPSLLPIGGARLTLVASKCPGCKAPIRATFPGDVKQVKVTCRACGGEHEIERRAMTLAEELRAEALGMFACHGCGDPLTTVHSVEGRNLCTTCSDLAVVAVGDEP